jgi:hypothetical protein
MSIQVAIISVAALLGTAILANRGAELPSQAEGAACQLGGIQVPPFTRPALEGSRFRALHAALTPRGPGERWTEIPWQSDLLAARQKAAREGKPLLMWVMDGHPLGCT